MLHQALEMTEPCSNEDMKARLLFEIQVMRKQSVALVTLPGRERAELHQVQVVASVPAA